MHKFKIGDTVRIIFYKYCSYGVVQEGRDGEKKVQLYERGVLSSTWMDPYRPWRDGEVAMKVEKISELPEIQQIYERS